MIPYSELSTLTLKVMLSVLKPFPCFRTQRRRIHLELSLREWISEMEAFSGRLSRDAANGDAA